MYYSIDCEMVGGYINKAMLAVVAVVNDKEEVVYEAYVKPTESITDFRNITNNQTKNKILNGKNLHEVKSEVQNIIKNQIIVGHDIKFDLEALGINHPENLIRDTAKYKLLQNAGQPRKLKDLANEILGRNIQVNEHSASEDAKAVMAIYKKYNF